VANLGSTGLAVSRLGLGLAALGRPGYINVGHGSDLGDGTDRPAMEGRAHRVLDAAYAAGVRYFDAARSYGLAEAFLASWLASRAIAAPDVTVRSKWGYTYTAGWRVDATTHEVKDHTVGVFVRQLDESRATLGAHLDLYQIHSATLESGVLDDAAVIDALASARESGLRMGLSVSGPRQAEVIWRAVEARRDGARVFDTVQATWNMLERAAGAALAAAHGEGLGVIVKEAVANGRLTDRGLSTVARPLGDAIAREAVRLDTTIDALALAWVLRQPWVDVVLSGATTVAQLESNLAAQRLTLPTDTVDRLDAIAMDTADYWRARSELAWN
jgi:aryl-alcohol dehydrogenase-like predicted oxidoreductase